MKYNIKKKLWEWFYGDTIKLIKLKNCVLVEHDVQNDEYRIIKIGDYDKLKVTIDPYSEIKDQNLYLVIAEGI